MENRDNILWLDEHENVLRDWAEKVRFYAWMHFRAAGYFSNLNNALSLPKFILHFKFGKTNREVRDYDSVVKRYLEKLKDAEGLVSPFSKGMKIPPLSDKEYIMNRLQVENKKLQYKTRKLTDKQLDELVLPHPLMGKMPVREIIMWTAYHTEHHTKQLMDNY